MLAPTRLLLSITARCEASARMLMSNSGQFGADTLALVKFDPSTITQNDSCISFPLEVTDDSLNAFQSMHGGAVATLADVFTTIHLWGLEPGSKHVSAGLEVSYLRPLPAAARVSCRTRVVKKGKRLAFTEFSFVDEEGTVLSKGTHTKAFI